MNESTAETGQAPQAGTVPALKPLEHTYAGMTRALHARYGKGAYHAAAALREIYRRGNPEFFTAPEFARPPGLAGRIASDLRMTAGVAVRTEREGGLVKFISRLQDGSQVESVIIPMDTYHTVCVSSQVGCRMGCRFCLTGRMGLVRNLAVEEIVGQVYTARFAYGAAVRNVVFMGMGEPLDNLDSVIQAISILEDQRAMNIARRYITVSTCGLVPGIERLARSFAPSVPLALSLNAADDRTRSQLMPINAKYPLAALQKALETYPLSRAGRLLVEYVLLKGVNDRPEDARRLVAYLDPRRVKINVIPFNGTPDAGYQAPDDFRLQRFSDILRAAGHAVRRRTPRGAGVLAACGQLGAQGAIAGQFMAAVETQAAPRGI